MGAPVAEESNVVTTEHTQRSVLVYRPIHGNILAKCMYWHADTYTSRFIHSHAIRETPTMRTVVYMFMQDFE